MYKILFIANNLTALSGMVFLIDKMREEYGITPVLLCDNCYFETKEYEVINLAKTNPKNGIGHSIKEYYNHKNKTLIHQLRNFSGAVKKMKADDRTSQEWLEKISVQAIVIYCDRMSGILQGFIKNAGKIPVIQIPVAVGRIKESFEGRRYNCELIVSKKWWDINRLALKINRNWAYTLENECRLFYPLGYCIAGYYCKMISMNPWVRGGGGSTYVLVENQKEAEEICRVSQKEVVVTGLLEDFYIYKEKENRKNCKTMLRNKYKIESEKIVVFSMPQLAEHNMVSWETHRKNMREVVELLSKICGKFLVSLHPKSSYEDYVFLHEYGDFEIVGERLRDIIAGCDVLVAISSSTVHRFAEVLSIKSVEIPQDFLLAELKEENRNNIGELFSDGLNGYKVDKKSNLQIKSVSKEIIRIIEKNNII